MIAGLSSGIATAIRTAGEARGQMDRSARQIATGKEVASVKDDGARWAQAAALKSRQAGNDARFATTSILKQDLMMQDAQIDAVRDAFQKLKETLVSALGQPAGSAARQQLAVDYAAGLQAAGAKYQPAGVVSGFGSWPDGFGIQTSASDPLLGGKSVFTLLGWDFYNTVWANSDFAGNPARIATVNVATDTDTQLRNGLAQVEAVLNQYNLERHAVWSANSMRWLDSVDKQTSRDNDRIDAAVSSLTDADLGKASTNLRQAETRQQLALTTVRQALDAYGSYAGGLLANAQRTQRALA